MSQTRLFLVASLFAPALALATGCVADAGDGEDIAAEGFEQEEGDEGGGDPGEAEPACEEGTTTSCETDEGEAGIATCVATEEGTAFGPCEGGSSSVVGTPLVFVFGDERVEFRADAAGAFDLAGMGASFGSDWPSARTPWLALDRDGDGRISDGSELFGSMTELSSGGRAKNGFEALAELDENGDGRISAEDSGFAKLVVWKDGDANRLTSPGELEAVSARIVSIDLGYVSERRCDARGNCEIERSGFRYVDASGVERSGEIVDVHLALR